MLMPLYSHLGLVHVFEQLSSLTTPCGAWLAFTTGPLLCGKRFYWVCSPNVYCSLVNCAAVATDFLESVARQHLPPKSIFTSQTSAHLHNEITTKTMRSFSLDLNFRQFHWLMHLKHITHSHHISIDLTNLLSAYIGTIVFAFNA